MTYAESLCAAAERRAADLRSLSDAIATGAPAGSAGWGPREILLHLAGALRDTSARLSGSLYADATDNAPRQAGGEYVDVPELATATDAAGSVVAGLEQIADLVRSLDDDALRSPVTLTDGEGAVTARVPLGLTVRHAITMHFDEHLEQLRAALGLPERT
jgi:hypothetical protein